MRDTAPPGPRSLSSVRRARLPKAARNAASRRARAAHRVRAQSREQFRQDSSAQSRLLRKDLLAYELYRFRERDVLRFRVREALVFDVAFLETALADNDAVWNAD